MTHIWRTVGEVFLFAVILYSNLLKGPKRRSSNSMFFLLFHSGSDWQHGVENKVIWHQPWRSSDDYRTVLKDFKIAGAVKKAETQNRTHEMRDFFRGNITEKPQSTILTFFQKSVPGSKHHKKNNLSFLVHRSARNSRHTFWKKNELEKVNGSVEKLDAHYDFLLKNCFSLQKLLYFLRTSTCFNIPPLMERNDKTVRDGLSKVYNVNF